MAQDTMARIGIASPPLKKVSESDWILVNVPSNAARVMFVRTGRQIVRIRGRAHKNIKTAAALRETVPSELKKTARGPGPLFLGAPDLPRTTFSAAELRESIALQAQEAAKGNHINLLIYSAA